ncbi:translocation/assembly module TamB domain-containing protein [Pseudooceanicola onchidii]|uniref:translocation/assembly module TamB domain-containing protein n=1 Tax=Pseudooceanicola onchidii TaxID=2562279 RepID=UPI0010AA4E91|nr:translocation/assembly module TamB domain-containing protein [Pseudooceanicola onchidii]
MIRIHTYLCAALVALVLAFVSAVPTPVRAQDDDGQGYLARLLQDTLSDAGRTVQIEGFRGALSSRATLDRMTIADDDGVWLELTGAVLDWNRSALLRGRLEVNELSAEALTITRAPAGGGSEAEASGFAIPDLPVSVNVGKLAIGQLRLGSDLLGEEAVFTFDGNALLDDSHLATTLTLDRVDRDGRIAVELDLQPEENQLVLNIAAEEPENGITARILDLPGRPALSLNVDGSGPLDDFTADIRLTSDGADRLAGSVTLRGDEEGAQSFAADVGGDLTALLLPQAREFLGDDVRLTVQGARTADGALSLDQFALKAATVDLTGSLDTTPDGKPARFDLTGVIAAADGAPVVLPFGTDLSLRRAEIAAQFDAAQGDDVSAQITMAGFAQPGTAIENGTLTLTGTLDTGTAPAVDLDIAAELAGVSFDDAAMQQALGENITARTRVTWAEGADLEMRGLDLQGTGYQAQVDATLTAGGGTSILTAAGRAALEDLGRFADLAGTDLLGAADATFDLSYDLLGGSFSVTATAATTDLALGIDRLDPVIGGNAALEVAVARSPEGITIDTFSLTNDQIALAASGTVDNADGRIDYSARLANSGAFMGVDGGPIELTGVVARKEDTFTITLDGGGEDLATGIAQADALLRGEVDVSARVLLNDRILLDRATITTPAMDIRAEGELTAGARQVTVTGELFDSGDLTGTPGGPLTATVTARESDAGFVVTLDGTGRDLKTGVAQADLLLRGRTQVTAQAVLGDLITLNRLDIANDAVTAHAEGDLTEGRRDVTLTARLADSGLPLGGTGGPLEATLRAVQDGEGYLLDLDGEVQNIGTGQALADTLLAGTTQVAVRGRLDGARLRLDSATVDGRTVTARASGVVASGDTALDFSARLASLAGVVPQAPAGPVSASGSVQQGEDGALTLNVTAEGPGGTNARVTGRAGLPGGAVDLDITGTAPLALANPYIAPRSVTGTASFDLAMTGAPGLDALSGQVTLNGGRASEPGLGLVVEDITGTVALSSGRAQLDLRAAMNGGALSLNGPVTLSGAYPANLTASLANVPFTRPGLVTTTLNGQVTVSGGLTGGGVIGGRIGLSGTELRIPSGGFGGVEPIPDMRHVNEDRASRTTRARAGLTDGDGSGGGSGSGSALGLNLRIESTDAMFLRGRGIDAELRGGLTLTGTTADVQPVGQFDLMRGRIDILTKRLEFTEGRVRLAGGFDPIVRLVAESQSGEYVVQIILDGPVAEPQVLFTSRPELPEDEVLSQLFFERDITSLSPFQAARLALAIAELTGKGGGGVVGKIRDGAGLDDLDVSQTSDGETALSAGKYISENVYTEVEATSGGKTSLSINLDVTRSLTAKGKVGSDGDSSLGLFFEKDY